MKTYMFRAELVVRIEAVTEEAATLAARRLLRDTAKELPGGVAFTRDGDERIFMEHPMVIK